MPLGDPKRAQANQIRKVAAFCDDAIHTAVVTGASAGHRRFADSRNTPCRPVWAQLPGSHERADSARFLLRPGGNSERDRLSDWTLVQVNPNSGQAISRAPRTHALAQISVEQLKLAGSTNFPPLRSEKAFPRDNARHGDRMNKCGGDAPMQALGLVEYS